MQENMKEYLTEKEAREKRLEVYRLLVVRSYEVCVKP